MNITYVHASKFGNGVQVAEEFRRRMGARGVTVAVHHLRDLSPTRIPPADLYLFSSPGRRGKPISGMRRFLARAELPEGSPYALLTTEMGPPKPDAKTGRVPTEEEVARWQRVRPIMNETLQAKGLVEVAEDRVYVSAIKGPLEDGWQDKVGAFAARIPLTSGASGG